MQKIDNLLEKKSARKKIYEKKNLLEKKSTRKNLLEKKSAEN